MVPRTTLSYPWPDAVRVVVTGEIDIATAPSLGLRLLAVIDHRHPTDLDVNLAAVTFLDCAGITMLVMVRAAAARTECRMRLTGTFGTVARVLDLAGVASLFTAPALPVAPATHHAMGAVPGRHRRSDVSAAGQPAA
jgi:anti-anti-sigma factor